MTEVEDKYEIPTLSVIAVMFVIEYASMCYFLNWKCRDVRR